MLDDAGPGQGAALLLQPAPLLREPAPLLLHAAALLLEPAPLVLDRAQATGEGGRVGPGLRLVRLGARERLAGAGLGLASPLLRRAGAAFGLAGGIEARVDRPLRLGEAGLDDARGGLARLGLGAGRLGPPALGEGDVALAGGLGDRGRRRRLRAPQPSATRARACAGSARRASRRSPSTTAAPYPSPSDQAASR
ncbi:MAG: hypothetical protein M9894_03275 [Planctomycetes bacterium]|nr:hypothetical protein [Planctomycetota bacterium]